MDHQLLKYLLRKRKYRGIETGGILGSSQGVITHYYHDEGGKQTDGGYFPNSEDLNWSIAQWKRVGIEFGALLCVHAPAPSVSNLRYVSAILSFHPRPEKVGDELFQGDFRFRGHQNVPFLQFEKFFWKFAETGCIMVDNKGGLFVQSPICHV